MSPNPEATIHAEDEYAVCASEFESHMPSHAAGSNWMRGDHFGAATEAFKFASF